MNKDTTKRQKFQHLTVEEREEIAIGLANGENLSEIARRLGRHRSTVSREIRRNRLQNRKYRGNLAQKICDQRQSKSRKKEILKNDDIRRYVREKLFERCSPEQIAGRMKIECPGWTTNHESIYRYIYSRAPELVEYLRQGRKKRLIKGFTKNKRCVRVPNRVMIEERPIEAKLRSETGHWEVDTMVSRKSRVCILGILDRKNGYVILKKLRAKTADEVHQKIVESLGKLPQSFCKTLTYDNGTENARHEDTGRALGMKTYFCHPYCSWQKGSVENLFGLLRQYLPKGIDLDKISAYELAQIERQLNTRPRKRYGFRSPAELFCNLVA